MDRINNMPADRMHEYVAYGRSLQGKAMREAIVFSFSWVARTLRSAFGRRVETRLGCTECGAPA
jgi:hypothetical protein